MILLHIEEFARISRLNDLMKLCKNASNASCLLLDPFLLAILLILSCIPAYEAQVRNMNFLPLLHEVDKLIFYEQFFYRYQIYYVI